MAESLSCQSLPNLIEEEKKLRDEINSLLRDLLSLLSTKEVRAADFWHSRVDVLKKKKLQFLSVSRHVTTRLTKESNNDADGISIRLARYDLINEVKEVLVEVNKVLSCLGEEEVSNCDTDTDISFKLTDTKKISPTIEEPSSIFKKVPTRESPTAFITNGKSTKANKDSPFIFDSFLDTLKSAEQRLKSNKVSFDDPIQTPRKEEKEDYLSSNDFPDFSSEERLDYSSRRRLREDLLFNPRNLYGGEPHLFWPWKRRLENEIEQAEVSSSDAIYILQANTTFRPNQVVSNLIASAGDSSDATLSLMWETLISRFGTSNKLTEELMNRLDSFPQIKSPKQIRDFEDFLDLCRIIDSNIPNCRELTQMNITVGMKRAWEKLPTFLQSRWQRKMFEIKRDLGRSPNFYSFVQFVADLVAEFSMPGFSEENSKYITSISRKNIAQNKPTKSLKTNIASNGSCALHPSAKHSSAECKEVLNMSYEAVSQFARDHRLCFRCLSPHFISNCYSKISCAMCGENHATALHGKFAEDHVYRRVHPAGERSVKRNMCTSVKRIHTKGSICSKTLLVDIKYKNIVKTLRCYCIVDEQSNASFVDHKLVNFFNINSPKIQYNISTLQGSNSKVTGSLVEGFKVKAFNSNEWIDLPKVYTSDQIPNTKFEVATRDIVESFPHISKFADRFPNKIKDYDVQIMIGSNCGPAMFTRCFGNKAPFVHKTSLGWALVGPICRDSNNSLITLRTNVDSLNANVTFPSVFKDSSVELVDDELLGNSKNDSKFMEIMQSNVCVNHAGNLQMPLPLKDSSPLPDNRTAVFRRTFNTLNKLKKEPEKLNQCLKVMGKYLESGHVRQVPSYCTPVKGETWYLPIFAVKHPKKDKTRLVFDSSASYQGVSLNQKLLQGPDNNNLLLGVILRFRNGEIGFSCDIETMFHSFHVEPNHCNYLRFFWYDQNNPSNKISEFQAMVHIFGNTCSPAIANFGLKYAAKQSPSTCGDSPVNFINNNMYVDDGLGAANTPHEAIHVLNGAQQILKSFNIRLYKIVSSCAEVTESFPSADVSDDAKVIFATGNDGETSTLGLLWRTKEDVLTLRSVDSNKPFTKRGILSANGSNFDPLGLACPVTLGGRLLQRLVLPPKSKDQNNWSQYDWDDPLPIHLKKQWLTWLNGLNELNKVEIPRGYVPIGFGQIVRRVIHVFCDSSKDSMAYVLYVQSVNQRDTIYNSFLFANSKVSQRMADTIPRMELCAAVEATLAARKISVELNLDISQFMFYTDSKVLLGYLNNQDKSFTRYVTRRIESILSCTNPEQWYFIATTQNPADIGTRPHTPTELLNTCWLRGPEFLWQKHQLVQSSKLAYPNLPEQTEQKVLLTSKVPQETSVSKAICERTNDLNRAISIMKNVLKAKCLFMNSTEPDKEINFSRTIILNTLIRNSQEESFPDVYSTLNKGEVLTSNNALSKLSPFIDNDGNLRVGGRLDRSDIQYHLKHPVILPNNHPVTFLILHNIHHRSMHSGRYINHGILRSEGYYIIGSMSVIRKLIKDCYLCRVLRAPVREQFMAELPADRIQEVPPFTNVGIDVFGPYYIHDGKRTRSNNPTKKMWGLLFTCLCSRAVHVEPLYEMDSSSFRNALRRFFAVRGVCKIIRSDQGTNFLGAKNEMDLEISGIKNISESLNIQWEFTTPGASSHAGVWERKIQSLKYAMSCALVQLNNRLLSRDELTTLFQEACNVVNNTPLLEFSTDPQKGAPLTPAMLLTLKESPNPPSLDCFNEKDLLQYGRKRWRRVQYLVTQFWARWRNEFMLSLQQRHKWRTKNNCVTVGDIVLLRDKSVKRNHWPTAVILDMKKSRDGLVRSVTLKVPSENNRRVERALLDTILLIPAHDHKCDLRN